MSNQAANNLANNLVNRNVTLVLFHNDLRVADNATLLKASEISTNGKLLLVYASSLTDILDDKDHYDAYRYEAMGQARQQFLHDSLADLNASLILYSVEWSNSAATSDRYLRQPDGRL